MRNLLFLLLCVCAPSFAKSVAFDFQAVSLVTFSQATFQSLLKRDYVISPDVLSMDKKITISVRAVDERDVGKFVESVLTAQGKAVEERQGVFYLTALKQTSPAPLEASRSVDPYASPAIVGRLNGRIANVVDSEIKDSQTLAPDSDTSVFRPVHRPAEFIAAAVSAVFGRTSATVAGPGVVLGGTKEKLLKLSALAAALDTAPLSVDVSVSWVEVTRSTGSARGVSLAVSVLGAKLGVSAGSVNSGNAVSLSAARFQAVIDALETDGRFKQVSNSRIVGDDREVMTLTVGDETPTVASSGKDNQGNAIQNIVYRPSGVIVHVTPRLVGSGKINLSIDGQISSFKSTVTGVSGSPTLIKREVKTGVTVSSGEVLLIGGLSDEHTSEAASGFSFLPASWRVKNSGSANTDLVLIVSAKAAPL